MSDIRVGLMLKYIAVIVEIFSAIRNLAEEPQIVLGFEGYPPSARSVIGPMVDFIKQSEPLDN